MIGQGKVIAYNLLDLLREQPTVCAKPKPQPKSDPGLALFNAQYGL